MSKTLSINTAADLNELPALLESINFNCHWKAPTDYNGLYILIGRCGSLPAEAGIRPTHVGTVAFRYPTHAATATLIINRIAARNYGGTQQDRTFRG